MMRTLLILPLWLLTPALTVYADVTQYLYKSQWQSAVGNNYTQINFTGWPMFTIITDQYSDLGVRFTDGNDYIDNINAYQNDGSGLYSQEFGIGYVRMTFAAPQYWFGVDHPGGLRFALYSGTQLLFTSGTYYGNNFYFLGAVSTEPFDRAVILNLSGPVAIDDLFFGPPIPAPGALALLGAAALLAPRRRRRQ